jgi:hypothetical protein
MTTEPQTRGYMIVSCVTHVQKKYAAADREAIMARLPKETLDLIDRVNTVEWYPRVHAKSLFTAIAHHHMEGDKNTDAALLAVGHSIAEMASNTFLRLIMKLMTPSLFAKKVGTFWERDHRGGELSADVKDIENKHLTIRHTGIGGYDFVAGTAPGFMGFALTAIGCKNVRSETFGFSLDNPGPEEVRYEMRWD